MDIYCMFYTHCPLIHGNNVGNSVAVCVFLFLFSIVSTSESFTKCVYRTQTMRIAETMPFCGEVMGGVCQPLNTDCLHVLYNQLTKV